MLVAAAAVLTQATQLHQAAQVVAEQVMNLDYLQQVAQEHLGKEIMAAQDRQDFICLLQVEVELVKLALMEQVEQVQVVQVAQVQLHQFQAHL
jgi:hypothetical protein